MPPVKRYPTTLEMMLLALIDEEVDTVYELREIAGRF